jgi:hypothetical protein
VKYELAKLTKSDLFRDLLPLLNSGRITLPRHDRLIAQLVGLERQVSRLGKLPFRMQLLLVRMMMLLMPVLVWPRWRRSRHMIPNICAGRIRRLRCSPLGVAIFLACVSSVEEMDM